MILCICAFILALVSIAFTWHLSIVYNRFNNQIREWSLNLDASARAAIDSSARNILRELDSKISQEKLFQNVNPLNNYEDDED